MVDENPSVDNDEASEREARPRFLIRCARFAAVTPPTRTTMLTAASVPREAHASTIGREDGADNDQRTVPTTAVAKRKVCWTSSASGIARCAPQQAFEMDLVRRVGVADEKSDMSVKGR
jgi:hypothetical protein